MKQAKVEKKVPLEWQIGIILPIYKKGYNKECLDYRRKTLWSMKMYGRILKNSSKNKLENSLKKIHSGFRRVRGTRNQIFILSISAK